MVVKQVLSVIAYDEPHILLRVIRLLSRYHFPLNSLSVKNGELSGSLEINVLAEHDYINTQVVKVIQRLIEVISVTLENK